jgi:hypothetical protein
MRSLLRVNAGNSSPAEFRRDRGTSMSLLRLRDCGQRRSRGQFCPEMPQMSEEVRPLCARGRGGDAGCQSHETTGCRDGDGGPGNSHTRDTRARPGLRHASHCRHCQASRFNRYRAAIHRASQKCRNECRQTQALPRRRRERSRSGGGNRVGRYRTSERRRHQSGGGSSEPRQRRQDKRHRAARSDRR